MAKKILLADDSITIQKVISITFSSEEFDLEIVSDGDAAIAKARDLRPDLVMADVAMPGKTGYEVCDAVKKDPALGNIPVLLLAGTFEPLNKDEAARVKADDSIVKPFESQELLDKVRKLVSREKGKAGAAEGLIGAEPLEAAAGAAKKPEVAEDIWAAGDFLGFTEEEPKAKEGGPAGLPDLEFLEGGLFEEAPKEELTREHEFTDLEFHEEELKPEEPKKEAPKAAEPGFKTEGFDSFKAEPFEMEPFDLTQFGAEEKKAEAPKEAAAEPFKETLELETFGAEPAKEPSREAPKETFELETFEPEPLRGFEKETKKEEPGKEEPKFEAPSFEPPFWTEPETKAPEPEFLEGAGEPFGASQPEIAERKKEPADFTGTGLFREEPATAPKGAAEEDIAKTISEAAARAEARFREELDKKLEGVEAQLAGAVEAAVARIEANLKNDLSVRLGRAEVQVSQAVEGAASKVEDRLKNELGSRLEKALSVPREQVEEIVRKAAKAAIEQVAWEVVPELAEELVKAEIAKFKEAISKFR